MLFKYVLSYGFTDSSAVNSFSLKPYYKKAFELASKIGKVNYSHIYRDQNSLADRLANEGLLLANS